MSQSVSLSVSSVVNEKITIKFGFLKKKNTSLIICRHLCYCNL